jgi:hypothetical protein
VRPDVRTRSDLITWSLIASLNKMFVKSFVVARNELNLLGKLSWLHQLSASACGYHDGWEHSQHNFQQNKYIPSLSNVYGYGYDSWWACS